MSMPDTLRIELRLNRERWQDPIEQGLMLEREGEELVLTVPTGKDTEETVRVEGDLLLRAVRMLMEGDG